MLKRCLAEGVGTAVLTLVACGVAVVANPAGWWVATALAFGLVIVVMAYSIGNVSGCHINPAVSLAMYLRKELTASNTLSIFNLSSSVNSFPRFFNICLITHNLFSYFISSIRSGFCFFLIIFLLTFSYHLEFH